MGIIVTSAAHLKTLVFGADTCLGLIILRDGFCGKYIASQEEGVMSLRRAWRLSLLDRDERKAVYAQIQSCFLPPAMDDVPAPVHIRAHAFNACTNAGITSDDAGSVIGVRQEFRRDEFIRLMQIGMTTNHVPKDEIVRMLWEDDFSMRLDQVLKTGTYDQGDLSAS